MKTLLMSTIAGVSLAVSADHLSAKEFTVMLNMANFSGPKAYAVVYLTDPNGQVHDTLHVAGGKSKYYRHLREWARGAMNSQTPAHAVTGASVGSGRTLQFSAEISDSLIAAGYQVRVDASVEDVGDYPRSAVLTLGEETAVRGRGIVRALVVN